jgi:hypothetical protein
MKEDKSWTTRDGTVVPIKEMTNTHLINTIAYLFRIAEPLKNRYADQLESRGWQALAYSDTTSAEIASYYAEQEGSNLLSQAEWLRAYDAIIVHNKMPLLIAEARKRGLGMPPAYNDKWITISEAMQEEQGINEKE